MKLFILFTFNIVSCLLNISLGIPINDFKEENDDWGKSMPFYRTLKLETPAMKGKDVTILQNLLRRHNAISSFVATGSFDKHTMDALASFEAIEKLGTPTGILTPTTARKVLDLLISDGYKDDGIVPDDCKFKLHVPVYRDRTIETNATLYKCGNGGDVLHVFKIRTRGSTGKKGQILNQLSTDGDTPTGLSTVDLDSREPKSLVKSYGPYPVLRVVKGIKGNVAIGKDNYIGKDGKDTFLSDYRSGILVHTGIWKNWDKSKQMPNSNGCMHVHPDDLKKIDDLLVEKAGATVNKNPFGRLPYPYKPQGIISIEQID